MGLESPPNTIAGRDPRLPISLKVDVVGLVRLALGLSALLIIIVDPPAPARFSTLTHAAFGLYVLYSGLLYLSHRFKRPPFFWRKAYWVDVCWYLLIVSLSSGADSIFFFFFFFPIIVASVADGFRAGFSVSVVSAVLFTAIGLATLSADAGFETNRFLMRLVILLLLGYLIAYWGDSELKLKARLALLRDLNDFSNPRFGIDRTIGYTMDRIRAGLNADHCMLVTADREAGTYRLRTCGTQAADAGAAVESIPPSFGSQLLSLPEGEAFVYPEEGGALWRAWRARAGAKANGGGPGRQAVEELAGIFDAKSFLTVPVRFGDGMTGRFYLYSNQTRAFDDTDAAFVTQTLNYVLPVIENIRLVDQLASTAAEHERQKIARDIHDSVIQPYVGLRIGLTGVRQKLEAGLNVLSDLDRLIELAEAEIAELRSYMTGLKGEKAGRDNLLPAVQRFTAKFAEATKLDLRVNAVGDLRINDRLAAEIFQMVAEGLSNIRRHTMARRATLTLEVRGDHFCLEIENDGWDGASSAPFSPRSLTERAQSLGGRLEVSRRADGGATLKIEIPL